MTSFRWFPGFDGDSASLSQKRTARPRELSYSPVDRIWLWIYYNKIPIYPIDSFYLYKGDYREIFRPFRGGRSQNRSFHGPFATLPRNVGFRYFSGKEANFQDPKSMLGLRNSASGFVFGAGAVVCG